MDKKAYRHHANGADANGGKMSMGAISVSKFCVYNSSYWLMHLSFMPHLWFILSTGN